MRLMDTKNDIVQFNANLLQEPNLSHLEKLVYMVLIHNADDNGYACLSYSELSILVGCNENNYSSIKAKIVSLEEKNFIEVHKAEKTGQKNKYKVLKYI